MGKEILKSNILSGCEILDNEKDADYLVIMLHGLGSNGDDLIELCPHYQALIQQSFGDKSPSIAYLSPHAPHDFDMADFGHQWFSMADNNVDKWQKGMDESLPILQKFIDEQLSRFSLNSDKVFLLGFSQGTMMACALSLSTPHPVLGVLGYSGALLMGDEGNINKNISDKTAYILLHGYDDDVVPFHASVEAQKILEKLNCSVKVQLYAGLPHSINQDGIMAGAKFIIDAINSH